MAFLLNFELFFSICNSLIFNNLHINFKNNFKKLQKKFVNSKNLPIIAMYSNGERLTSLHV